MWVHQVIVYITHVCLIDIYIYILQIHTEPCTGHLHIIRYDHMLYVPIQHILYYSNMFDVHNNHMSLSYSCFNVQ